MTVLNRIENVIREFFDNESIIINEETSAKNIDGWDSLANVQIMLSIEMEFNIEPFSIDELVSFKKIGDIVKNIESKI